MTEHTLRLHAQRLVDQELHRRRGALAGLSPAGRARVERLVAQAVAVSVDGVLERARHDPLVAAALESVYGHRSFPAPAPVTAD